MITLHATDKNHGIGIMSQTPLVGIIDRLMIGLARVTAWCVPVMALLVFCIVLLRYGFNTGAIAAQESVQYLHAAVFMLGSAIALAADQHVRVDIFYRHFTTRQRAWVNTLGHIIFTLPLCALIGWGSLDYVADSWSAREASPEPGGLPFVFLLKTLIPSMAILLGLQAGSAVFRGINILQTREPV
jgi:TRAP-type mannitol/chloroaromatic compound transport system permease small subunit